MSPPNSSRSFCAIVASVDPKPADRPPACVLQDAFQIALASYPPAVTNSRRLVMRIAM